MMQTFLISDLIYIARTYLTISHISFQSITHLLLIFGSLRRERRHLLLPWIVLSGFQVSPSHDYANDLLSE